MQTLNNLLNKTLLIFLAASLFIKLSAAENKTKYATPQTQEIIEKMIEAHGGMLKWKDAPTLSYHHEMVAPYDKDDIWASDEIIEQGKKRIYAE